MSFENRSQSGPRVRRFFRPDLRQITLILPRTGRRVRRAITLRGSRPNGDDTFGERVPLLDRQNRTRRISFSVLRRSLENITSCYKRVWALRSSRIARGVLKCSLAYFVGSLATFVPPVASFLGQQDGKHIVATITVYFHPARSQGSMFEATLLASLAFFYIVFISFTSMGVTFLFGKVLDLLVLGHIIVLIVFCGGGLGFIGWTKQKLGNPLVNVSCSLASLAIITILTKEGSVQAGNFSVEKVIQVMKMVIMGVIATTTVCFVVFPISARQELRQNMIDVMKCFSTIFTTITHSFLCGSEDELKRPDYKEASEQFPRTFALLIKNLKEAKYEHYVMGTERQYHVEARLVNCMQRLAQNLGGLRSAASTEFTLLQQSALAGEATPIPSTSYTPITSHGNIFSPSSLGNEYFGALSAIDEEPGEDEDANHLMNSSSHATWNVSTEQNIKFPNTPSEIFAKFILQLGPSMKSLAFTSKYILNQLPFGSSPDSETIMNNKFRNSLTQAIDLYVNARADALAILYRDNELTKAQKPEVQADFEEVAASCGHFSSSLQEFAENIVNFLDILDELQLELSERPTGRTWNWIKFWRWRRDFQNRSTDDPERDSLMEAHSDRIQGEIARVEDRRGTRAFVAEKLERNRSFNHYIWSFLKLFSREDLKFAIKVGVGAALYALPSFLPSTRPIYQHWRGEWGLLSYMLVCSMTIGASNTTGISRFLGTCLGATCAIFAWFMTQGNPFFLAAFGWFMALWTAYIIIGFGNGPMGRFIMLTYNLSALYAYSLSVEDANDDDDEGGLNPIITEIALHRVVAVFTGCLWGLFITRIIWPISARQKLANGLSLLWFRMGLIWKRDPLSMVLEGESPNPYMNLREEFELQRYLSRLRNLRNAASSEFDLRGSFPDGIYSRILQATGRTLDAFHAMNVVIVKNGNASEGEKRILNYTANERAQLAFRISFLFQVIASSMKLEYPLNDALPRTDHARDRLLAKIFGFRRIEEGQKLPDEDFALLYAYALVTGQVAKEIQSIVEEIESLFGILDEDILKLQ